MSKKQTQETVTENDIDLQFQETSGKVERFINENKMLFLIGSALLFLALIAYFSFSSIYVPNQNQETQAAMYKAQQYFDKDDFQKALDGDGENDGFLDIIGNYSGLTKSHDLAHYYAGISYLNLGKFEEAIDYLSKYDGNDIMVSTMALGAMGDAYMELGENDKGMSYYSKAANNSDNEFTAPLFLYKSGLALEANGDSEGAKKQFEKIKSKYPKSQQAGEATKYLAR